MPANLVLLPLEGVSQTLFWQFREAMPFLWECSLRSAMFRRFYTASTSALQSFCDVAYGDSAALDHNPVYPDGPGCIRDRSGNIFSLLRGRGYEVAGAMRAAPRPGYAERNFYGAWPDSCGEFRCHDEYGSFYAAIDGFIGDVAGKAPFILYVADRAAAIGDVCGEKAEATLFHTRFEKGYSLLDRTARHVMDRLAAAGVLENTFVVFYGSCGLDPWKHGIYAGKTRALDPYADACWTPMFIYNNNNDIGTADQLVSSIDLKQTFLHMLFPDEPAQQPADASVGVDILRFQRQAVFTQNMFALECENNGPTRGLVKSYGVTDGDQRLIVSSNGGIAGEGGMELYYDPRDPSNTRNFLDFFELDQDGVMLSFGRPDIVHVHFIMSFKQPLVMSVVQSYNTMREQLYHFIRSKEQEALKHCRPDAAGNLFPDGSFKVKRKRK